VDQIICMARFLCRCGMVYRKQQIRLFNHQQNATKDNVSELELDLCNWNSSFLDRMWRNTNNNVLNALYLNSNHGPSKSTLFDRRDAADKLGDQANHSPHLLINSWLTHKKDHQPPAPNKIHRRCCENKDIHVEISRGAVRPPGRVQGRAAKAIDM
jgi:hypothetical protein